MWSRFVVALVLLAVALFETVPGFAQSDPRRDNDPILIPEGQTQVEYSRVEDMPRQLQRVFIRHCGREQSDTLKDIPARIFKPSPRDRAIALVPCGRIMIGGRAFVIGRWWEPVPIAFVVMAYPAGFTISENPGFLEWHPESLKLTAMPGNDMLDCERPSKARYTYSYSANVEFPFMLTKVEAIADSCAAVRGVESVTLWESPVWSEKLRQ